MRVLFPKMKYADFLQSLKDERFLALTVLVCNTCYFEVTQKHDNMSKRATVEPHKGDIIKLLKKEKKSAAQIAPVDDDQLEEGEIDDEEDDEDEDNEEEDEAYILEQRTTLTRPFTSMSRGLSIPDKKLSLHDPSFRGTILGSEMHRIGDEISLPKNPSSTNYTENRTVGSRLISGNRQFNIKKLQSTDSHKRLGLDFNQAMQVKVDPLFETQLTRSDNRIQRIKSSQLLYRVGQNRELKRPTTSQNPRGASSSKKLG